jgi:circadian clock protein KaiC
VELVQHSTGVPGLDEVLGGGIPERSFTIITGPAGTGKTTLAQQLVFANASEDHQVAYFCGVAEPAAKLCAHLTAFAFFDNNRLECDVHFVDVSAHSTERDAGRALDLVRHALQTGLPGMLVVDMPRSLTPPGAWTELGLLLASSGTTAVLVDEGDPDAALLSLADTIIRLDDGSVEATKTRGREPLPGRHAFRIDAKGVRVFPRWPTPRARVARCPAGERLSTGIETLDGFIGGGVLAGSSVLVEGPSGTGKTVLATQFLAETAHQGLPTLVVLCEERPDRWIARGEQLGLEVQRLGQMGFLELMSARGRDLGVDELTYLIDRAAIGMRADAIVIDSTTGLQLVAKAQLSDWLWRLVDRLTANGTTVWVNHTPSGEQLGALFDNVIRLRRLEQNGQIQNRLEFTKVSAASNLASLVPYEIGSRGVQISSMDESRLRTNGHLVPYRLAANGR